jgi:hypothetical protein
MRDESEVTKWLVVHGYAGAASARPIVLSPA